ncbi:unnamed protein product [Rodentolepis nana]|uniref:DUF1830 domain-containing protein n=1 Tax=Rodentolepis nana TaxID=102285 RepID=A0A0R3TTJ2_RODNA|nr:unnamed protein product [Rodentolepis nana]
MKLQPSFRDSEKAGNLMHSIKTLISKLVPSRRDPWPTPSKQQSYSLLGHRKINYVVSGDSMKIIVLLPTPKPVNCLPWSSTRNFLANVIAFDPNQCRFALLTDRKWRVNASQVMSVSCSTETAQEISVLDLTLISVLLDQSKQPPILVDS